MLSEYFYNYPYFTSHAISIFQKTLVMTVATLELMSPKQICPPDLDYILQINSEYGLFFCLPEIDNSKI